MANFFRFCDRAVPVTFFEGPGALTVKLTISDETDKAFQRGAELLKQGLEASNLQRREEIWTQAIDAIIGPAQQEAILSRAPVRDGFALMEVYRYLVDSYNAAKAKNLSASAR